MVIPNNRTNPALNYSYDNPDKYRDKVSPPVPFGFRREWGDWNIDPSRTELSFSWVDKEFGRNVYPPGIVSVKASHNVRTIGRINWA